MRTLLFSSSILILLTSCEKEITVDLNSADQQIIIEGNVTDQPGPYTVKITKTVNFTDDNDNQYPPVTNAVVSISDNTGFSETLTETAPGVYITNQLVGSPLKTYTLKVNAEGKEYQANSTMPAKVNLDSLRFTLIEGGPGSGNGNNYFTIPLYQDPTAKGNNYRFILTVDNVRNDEYFVANDNIQNGKINEQPLRSFDTEVEKGDSVLVEMRCIDLSTYNYFFTLSQIAGNGPGGGTTPTNPPNNITGNKALGYFSAHTVQFRKQAAQ